MGDGRLDIRASQPPAREGSPVALVIGLAVLPILYPILRAVFGRLAGAEAGRLEGVVEDLARLVRESADRSSEDPS